MADKIKIDLYNFSLEDFPSLTGGQDIWAYEHPVKTTLAAIATLGASSGIGYALIEYFGR